ncbi:hypothetical protein Airi01_048290 [Actinoallomurus iriomotensis]|uniref:Uncharacterized protein n=2 Tax=Actinoallomurus iriomotensis TaxID=478107 RepID=A0A9W6RM62_9ACTN|nr:hypothetical protein Airi01_048290 [Actinoallomurus iriomotensis]
MLSRPVGTIAVVAAAGVALAGWGASAYQHPTPSTQRSAVGRAVPNAAKLVSRPPSAKAEVAAVPASRPPSARAEVAAVPASRPPTRRAAAVPASRPPSAKAEATGN